MTVVQPQPELHKTSKGRPRGHSLACAISMVLPRATPRSTSSATAMRPNRLRDCLDLFHHVAWFYPKSTSITSSEDVSSDREKLLGLASEPQWIRTQPAWIIPNKDPPSHMNQEQRHMYRSLLAETNGRCFSMRVWPRISLRVSHLWLRLDRPTLSCCVLVRLCCQRDGLHSEALKQSIINQFPGFLPKPLIAHW